MSTTVLIVDAEETIRTALATSGYGPQNVGVSF